MHLVNSTMYSLLELSFGYNASSRSDIVLQFMLRLQDLKHTHCKFYIVQFNRINFCVPPIPRSPNINVPHHNHTMAPLTQDLKQY